MKTLLFVLLLLFFSLSILIKAQPTFDPQLVLEKEIVFGGLGDNIFAAIPDNDGYIVSGMKLVRDGSVWKKYSKIMKLDNDGIPVWQYTGTESTTAWWQSLALAPDGIFLGEGWETSSISKLDNQGGLVWKNNLGTEAHPILVSDENYLIVILSTYSVSKVMVLDLNGNEINSWDVVINMAYATILDGDDLYILGDNPGGVLTNVHSEIIKTDLQGNIAWSDTLMDVYGLRGAIDANGDLYVSGKYWPSQILYRTVKYNADNGNRVWERLWDGDLNASYNLGNSVNSLIAHPNGGVVVVGSLVKIGGNDPNALDGGAISYDSEGNVYFKIRYDYQPETYNDGSWFTASLFDNNNGLLIFGASWTSNPNDASVLFLTKWDNVTGVEDEPYAIPESFSLSQNYPNPFNPSTTINFTLLATANVTLKVYDVLGKEVAVLVSEERPAGLHSVEFNAADLPSGIYFYKLEAGNFIA